MGRRGGKDNKNRVGGERVESGQRNGYLKGYIGTTIHWVWFSL